ncbi:hypothetical protein FOCG_17697 [Fusarium oxysporum f. sp. radicis-lycopersici 26381]|nr:hypothetical protein FOCG_17697 [Fusarium oxysporum f. sp. radicis-lycopersici 26381]
MIAELQQLRATINTLQARVDERPAETANRGSNERDLGKALKPPKPEPFRGQAADVKENEIDPPLSGTSWDLIHAYELLLEALESPKRAVANFPDGHHLAININLDQLKLNKYYKHLNDSPLIYSSVVLHPAYRWALFIDLWGDDGERQLWITKAKEMVQDFLERDYRDLEVDDPEIELPTNKRPKTSRNNLTAWRTKKR